MSPLLELETKTYILIQEDGMDLEIGELDWSLTVCNYEDSNRNS